jgi:hypothetical protein
MILLFVLFNDNHCSLQVFVCISISFVYCSKRCGTSLSEVENVEGSFRYNFRTLEEPWMMQDREQVLRTVPKMS